MRYLKGIVSYGIQCSGYSVVLEGYSDSNWIPNFDVLYVTSGYVFIHRRWRCAVDVL